MIYYFFYVFLIFSVFGIPAPGDAAFVLKEIEKKVSQLNPLEKLSLQIYKTIELFAENEKIRVIKKIKEKYKKEKNNIDRFLEEEYRLCAFFFGDVDNFKSLMKNCYLGEDDYEDHYEVLCQDSSGNFLDEKLIIRFRSLHNRFLKRYSKVAINDKFYNYKKKRYELYNYGFIKYYLTKKKDLVHFWNNFSNIFIDLKNEKINNNYNFIILENESLEIISNKIKLFFKLFKIDFYDFKNLDEFDCFG